MEQYRSMRIAYFTENLELTPEEAEKFWPLYNQHEKNKEEIMHERRIRSREFRQQAPEISEEEAQEIIDRHIEARKKEHTLDIKFHEELTKILPAKKIMQFYITEVKFREYMLRKIREERGHGSRGEKRNTEPGGMPYTP
jgi:hypothetical protein